MMVTVRSLGFSGISGYEVSVECFLSGGLPGFDIVGLPDAAVREARERVRAAVMKACGARFPVSRITVNLAPARRRKEGTVYDLPILLGILAASEEIPPAAGGRSLCGRAEPYRRPALRWRGSCPWPWRRPDGHPPAVRPAQNAPEATLARGHHGLPRGKYRAAGGPPTGDAHHRPRPPGPPRRCPGPCRTSPT